MPWGRSKKKKAEQQQTASSRPNGSYTLTRDGRLTGQNGEQTLYKVHPVAQGDQPDGKRYYILEEVAHAAKVQQWLHSQDNARPQKAHKTGSTLISGQSGHMTARTGGTHQTQHVTTKSAGRHHTDGGNHVTSHSAYQSIPKPHAGGHYNRESAHRHGGTTTASIPVAEHHRSSNVHSSPRPGSARAFSSGINTIERTPAVVHREETTATVHREPRSHSAHVTKETSRDQHAASNGYGNHSSTMHSYTATASNYGSHSPNTNHVKDMTYANGGINTLTLLNGPPSRNTFTERPPSHYSSRNGNSHYDVTDFAIAEQNARGDSPNEKTYIRWSPTMRRKSQQDIVVRNPEVTSQASYVIANNTLPLGSHMGSNQIHTANTLPSARSRTSRTSRPLPCV